jgi:hypothetical protein
MRNEKEETGFCHLTVRTTYAFFLNYASTPSFKALILGDIFRFSDFRKNVKIGF